MLFMLNRNDVAIFCTGDKKYIPQMIVALHIACNKNDFTPFIVTDAPDEEIELVKRFDITTLRIDLKETFDRYNQNWPSQSFWWCAAPALLHDLGYKYSIFIDADVYCNKTLDLSLLNDDLELAARELETKNEFNSGVILFNNEKMVNKDLYTKFINAYTPMSTIAYERFHGGKVHDQQVLSAIGSGYNQYSDFLRKSGDFEIKKLDILWNYQFHRASGQNDEYLDLDYREVKEKVSFAHFLMSRPWQHHKSWGGTHGLFKTRDFPHGWVVKNRGGEPRPETRIQFVMDWREEVRKIEHKYGFQMFNDFGKLEEISL